MVKPTTTTTTLISTLLVSSSTVSVAQESKASEEVRKLKPARAAAKERFRKLPRVNINTKNRELTLAEDGGAVTGGNTKTGGIRENGVGGEERTGAGGFN